MCQALFQRIDELKRENRGLSSTALDEQKARLKCAVCLEKKKHSSTGMLSVSDTHGVSCRALSESQIGHIMEQLFCRVALGNAIFESMVNPSRKPGTIYILYQDFRFTLVILFFAINLYTFL